MTQSAVTEHKIVRDAEPRSAAHPQTDAKAKTRPAEAEAPIVERVRNVGGRLMA
jgi:hypothetical protein